MNMVDAIYKAIETRVVVTNLIVWDQKDNGISKSLNSGATLKHFTTYVSEEMFQKMKLRYDHAAFLTANEGQWGQVMGEAYRGHMCNIDATSVNRVLPDEPAWETAQLISHEMGHSVGWRHISSCGSGQCLNPPCVMEGRIQNTPAKGFSQCHIDLYHDLVKRGKLPCILEYPRRFLQSPTCGNGLVEKGEQCDCGSVEECNARDGVVRFPAARPITKSSLLGTLRKIGKEYTVKFQVKPTRYQRGWTSVLHMTSTDINCCGIGDRLPGVWFFTHSENPQVSSLQVCSAVNDNGLYCIDSPRNVQRGRWTTVEVSQKLSNGSYRYEVKLDYNIIQETINTKPRDFYNVKVYVSDPWHNPLQGSIRGIILPNDEGKQCAKKMFDGRPREWRSSSGKEIKAFGGYWTVEECKTKCVVTPGCQEFRVKKNRGVSYSGCVLMRSGTTRSGEMATSFEMHKLVECSGYAACCNPLTCKLKAGAQCAIGRCCHKCKFKPRTVICRAKAQPDCDLEEFCTGKSEHCPENTYRRAGTPCADGASYCFLDKCNTLDSQCKKLWGPTMRKAHEECFDMNAKTVNERTDRHANCGKNDEGKFVKCAAEDKFCGKLWCGPTSLAVNKAILPIIGVPVYVQTFTSKEKDDWCKTVVLKETMDMPDPTYDHTGAKCGNESICVQNKCMHISNLVEADCSPPCENGAICNNKGLCQCPPGARCINMHPCDTSNGGCEHVCIRKDTTAACGCNSGFVLGSDEKSCKKVNGQWSTWGSWGECTTTCGTAGRRSKTRTCTSSTPNKNNDAVVCEGERSSSEPCNIVDCPGKQCARKMFDGRPREWRPSSGKEIKAIGGYWSVNECKSKCMTTPGCQEFRVKKNRDVSYSGCVLMQSGTTRSGEMASSFEMYKMVECTGKLCADKIFNGRPHEWRSSSGKEIKAFGGYWTIDECQAKCESTPGCQEFRVKKDQGVSYSGCVLMRSGTTRSGEFTSWYEMYKLVECRVCVVEFYDHREHLGRKDIYTRDTLDIVHNDQMSSFKVSPGCCVTLFQNTRFRGESRRECRNINWVGDQWNDRVSSLRISRGHK